MNAALAAGGPGGPGELGDLGEPSQSAPTAEAAAEAARPEGFLTRVLEQFAFEYCEDLFWRVDNGVVNIYVTCSDTFAWGCADAEQITPENIDLLEATRLEVEGLLGGRYRGESWPLLWCARVRGMRPQGAAYKYIPPELHALYDACGPVREAGLGNPVAR